jgi:hypothetical protein
MSTGSTGKKVITGIVALIVAIFLAAIIFSVEKKALTSIIGSSSKIATNQPLLFNQPSEQANTQSNYQPNIESKNQPDNPQGDLVSFSIMPNSKVHGIMFYKGTLQGGYFFEGNVLINILDSDKKILKKNNAIAKTDWLTSGPVDFEGNIDFTSLPKGPAYFQIHNDNASGLSQNDKSILIPIVIE